MSHDQRPTVVITGASAGVGRAVVRRFAGEDKARIGLIARGRQRLERAADEVRMLGGEALVLPCDVADWDAVDAAADRVEQAFGPIDIWVNVAMVTMLAPFHEISPEEFRRGTEVTYLGNVHGTLAALRRMRARDHGTIVQVGSALAYRSIPLQSVYCGAKSAINGFTDSIRCELLHDNSNVKITIVHLPAVNTPQFDWMRNKMPHRPQPLPPIFQPEIPAEAIHFAAHHPRREMWVGRTTWETILGQKVAPGALDRYLAKTGYSSQQTGEPAGNRPDNLFEPVEGDYAAHGRFDDRATCSAPMLKASERPKTTAALLALGLGAILAGTVMARRSLNA